MKATHRALVFWVFHVLRDYAHTDGSLGYFQHSFSVYGREAEACPRDDGGVVRRIVQGGRSTFFCPVCQR